MKRIISMAVVLVITMAAMAQKGELAMNENISGKDHISKNEKEATFNMGHILDCANVMCFDDNSKSFEEALKSADEPEEIIALFNQVTLRKL